MTPGDHTDSDVYRFEFSPTEETAAMAVVDAVATVLDTDPLALSPMGKTISGNVLNAVDEGDDTTVTFSYEGVRITVHSDGQIVIHDPK